VNQMEESQKRQVACKSRIIDILEGRYVKEEGWQPNYVLTKEGMKISRINLIATVVDIIKDSLSNTVVVDDGTGTISIRSFEGFLELRDIEIGDLVNIIGKPREFGQEKYLLHEVIRKIKDNRWAEVRTIELTRKERSSPLKIEAEGVVEALKEKGDGAQKQQDKTNPFQKILGLIKEMDTGDGAEISDVVKRSGLTNTDEIISELLKEGEIFEIRRGRLKALE
jgi:RPA family protein